MMEIIAEVARRYAQAGYFTVIDGIVGPRSVFEPLRAVLIASELRWSASTRAVSPCSDLQPAPPPSSFASPLPMRRASPGTASTIPSPTRSQIPTICQKWLYG
jgi:hypothetical protein